MSLTQDYLDGIELKNNAVEAVYNEEGRAYNTGSGYRYEYMLRDHLGNTRLVFTDKDGSGSIDNSEILAKAIIIPLAARRMGPNTLVMLMRGHIGTPRVVSNYLLKSFQLYEKSTTF